ncbi:PREDICTED: uncharacterized protein LOC109362107 [Lupinus angustifolius]|uniref:uncharacterized protein LOC109362107 n=1 Tax=Lupinus angustifolius TaxID=3871 RepID=UPI00092F0E2A|nr:PREDICTED: uncharacterized protein LOC109362107 [Lupinus angustifolius]
MNKMDCDLHEMLNMLIDYQNQIDSGKNQGFVLVVGKSNKKKGKWNNKPRKKPFAHKGGVTKPRDKKGGVDQTNVECFFCKENGHWKRNCHKYLDSLKEKKQGTTNN